MHIERTQTVTMTARSLAEARAKVAAVTPVPDARWTKRIDGSIRNGKATVKVTFILDTPD